ncbi:MAG: hypothetical protein IJ006_05240 [Lachnospiraceae bacterium]|nr:hypothetical protein [Lachnospiraceae bacterium]
MKKLIISMCILLFVVAGVVGYRWWWREAHTLYQAEPPASHVSEADWVTLTEDEVWIPGWGDVITSDKYYWKDWKRQLNGTESETLYYAHQESWDAFVKKAHARELKRYERIHSGGGGIFHSFNDIFCVVEQNHAGLQPEVEGVSQLVKENGKSKVTLYVSYAGEGVADERMTYYYFVKLPEGLPRIEEIVISTDREKAETNE